MRLRTPGAKSEITYLVITNCPTRYILWFGLRKLGTGLGTPSTDPAGSPLRGLSDIPPGDTLRRSRVITITGEPR